MSDDEGWEARMAARAAARREQAQRVAQARGTRDAPSPEQPGWLNGWPRPTAGGEVLIGTEVLCVCCGRSRGTTCVAFPADWEPPGPDPQWPFHPDDCPLCHALGWLR